MKTLGVIGGMSWESSAIYYRLLNEEARRRLGGLHSAKLLLWSFDFHEIAALQAQGDWAAATIRMVDAARHLKAGGAEGIVISTNTMHKMAAEVEQASGLPLIHITDATAQAIQAQGLRKVGLLATRFTMEQEFYIGRMRDKYGIEALVPDDAGRTDVHRIIYEELCRGHVRAESKARYQAIIADLARQGVEEVILGCTEICMLIQQQDIELAVFDSTALHVSAAVTWALDESL